MRSSSRPDPEVLPGSSTPGSLPSPRPPRGLTSQARADWRALARPTPTVATYAPASTAGLPEPVRRWLDRSIDPGTRLATSVELRMHGEIRLGVWRPFTAVQRLAPDGFVWAARLRLAGLPITGFDRYSRGSGQMRWRLLGAVPVTAAEGADVTRSAAGRLAGELLLAVPATALRPDVLWRADVAGRAVALVPVGAHTHQVTLTIAPGGALTELVMNRWGDPGGGFGLHAFGAALHGRARFGGFTVPRSVTAGWFHGTDRGPAGEFIRYTVDDMIFR